ncbi:hypothetical protein CERSUDRAFT_112462 [Gelatoporia subvermispora B]|uniref:D-isomer specific 2-hydroxyacid dehydrogenase NAD-binding domain-containing protein n=1 Tax=Ceriporiopsis subvermispora (strain B) TaxID=914234 RepID=M2RJU3_CERS8|nr:hypothetical protein CERSUDRAFT_112462 [Gelatoporia subvermispora B]
MSLLYGRQDISTVVWPENSICDRIWLLENVKGATGILAMRTETVDTELLDAAGPSLKAFSTFSVGYEHLPLEELAKRKIKLGYTPDVLTDGVADIAIMLALMASRNVGEATDVVRKGEWPRCPRSPFLFCGPQLSASAMHPSRTAGFIGFGRIAQATLKRLVPFGVTECIYLGNPNTPPNPKADALLARELSVPSIRRVPLSEIAEKSDVVFVLAPGGPETYHIVDEAFLRRMKPTAVLVNVARGTLVDSDTLAKALRERWIWGAGLDVVEGEPVINADHPLVNEPRCIVLPHVGTASTETRQAMAVLAVENVIAGVLGLPIPAEVYLHWIMPVVSA